MDIKNRLVIIIFFLILSPIFGIAGLVLLSLINPSNSTLPSAVKTSLNWFSQNPDFSRYLMYGFFGLAALFLLICIYNIAGALFDNGSDSDVK